MRSGAPCGRPFSFFCTSCVYKIWDVSCLSPSGRALLENLLNHRLDEIGWDGKIDTIGRRVGLGIFGTRECDADELPLQIDQGPTAIAGIEGGIGLDGVGNGDATGFGDAAITRIWMNPPVTMLVRRSVT